MVNIVMLIVCIRHVVRLHVEDEYVVAEQAALSVQYVVHFGLVFHPLKGNLLLSHRWKAEVFNDFATRAVAVATVSIQQFGGVGDRLRHLDLLAMVLVRMVLFGEALLDLEDIFLVHADYEKILN